MFPFPLHFTLQVKHPQLRKRLCPEYQDTGESHASAHLQVGVLEDTKEAEPGKQRTMPAISAPSRNSRKPTDPENLVASGKEAHIPALWRQLYPQHRQPGSSGSRAWDPIPPASKAPAIPAAVRPKNRTPPDMAEVHDPRPSCTPSLPQQLQSLQSRCTAETPS